MTRVTCVPSLAELLGVLEVEDEEGDVEFARTDGTGLQLGKARTHSLRMVYCSSRGKDMEIRQESVKQTWRHITN